MEVIKMSLNMTPGCVLVDIPPTILSGDSIITENSLCTNILTNCQTSATNERSEANCNSSSCTTSYSNGMTINYICDDKTRDLSLISVKCTYRCTYTKKGSGSTSSNNGITLPRVSNAMNHLDLSIMTKCLAIGSFAYMY